MNARQPSLGLTMLLAALAAIGPFSIDTYLPALPQIGTALQASPLQIQQTLSAYLIAFSLMTLWHGALSDSFGRRPVILAGIAVYGLASLGCTLANSIEMLWLMRALQGLSAGAGMVVSRAMVRDLYAGATAQRLMSHIAMMFAIAPAIAPMLGGWLLGLAGWRATFACLTLMALALWLACWRLLPESLLPEKRQPFSPTALFNGYRQVLSHGAFLAASLGIGSGFGGFFIYVLSAPVFLLEHLQLGPRDFHWLFVPAMAGMMGGSWLSARVAGRWSNGRSLATALVLLSSAAAMNLLVSALLPPRLVPSLLPIPLYTLGMALAMPSLTLRALDCFPEKRGMAASCQSFLQTLLSAGIAAGVAPALWETRLGLAMGMTGLGALGVVLVLVHLKLTRTT